MVEVKRRSSTFCHGCHHLGRDMSFHQRVILKKETERRWPTSTFDARLKSTKEISAMQHALTPGSIQGAVPYAGKITTPLKERQAILILPVDAMYIVTSCPSLPLHQQIAVRGCLSCFWVYVKGQKEAPVSACRSLHLMVSVPASVPLLGPCP